MDEIKKFFKNDHYAAHSGIELLEVSPGKAKAKMDIKDIHFNGLKTVHGGAIFTLADFVFAVAANTCGMVTTSINAQISYFKPGLGPTLLAEAEEISSSSKLATFQVSIKNQQGELVALFQGMGYKKNQPLKDVI